MRPIKELVADLKASYPRIEEAIPGLKRKSDKEYCGACPNPGCKVDNDGFLVFPKTQKFWCRGCEHSGDIIEYYRMTGNGDMMQQLKTAGLLEDKEASSAGAARAKGKDNLPAYVWGQSKNDAEADAIIQKAFAFRSIQLEQIPPNIRLNNHNGQLSIACAMQSPLDENPPAKPQCVHLTMLDEEGKKKKRSETSPSTKYQGPKTGLAVMLPGKDSSSLVIGEGLETTLSAMQAMGFSGMICGDAGNMAGMSRLPEQFQQIFILVDSDTNHAGQKAAVKAVESIGKANPQAAVYLVTPDDSCFMNAPVELDFNDLLRENPSGDSIKARFEKKQRLDEIDWRPKEKEQPDETAEPEKIKPVEVWSFADVEEILELHPELLKWIVCAPDQELTTARKYELAEEILLHNSFRPAELHAAKGMLKKRLGVAKGEQDKLVKGASKEQPKAKAEPDGNWFLVEERKGELKLAAQSRAAQIISEMTSGKFIYTNTESWYRYTGTHWSKCVKKEFSNHLVESLAKGTGAVGFSAGYMDGVESIMVNSGLNIPVSEIEREAVPFENGILDTKTGDFEPTNPENAMIWCLPYDYNPDARCEFFNAWLDQVCDDETKGLQRMVRAVINVSLIPRPDLHFFVHLFGRPRTGKGTFTRLLQKIVGPDNFYVSDIELLENSVTGRFEAVNFGGKRILIFNEFPSHIKSSKFLALTGRDAMRCEEKKKQGGASLIYAGLVLMAGNSLFSTDDQTNYAIEERRRTLSFDAVMSAEDRKDFTDAGGERLLHEDIPGIINWALGMSREEVSEVFYNPPAKVVAANQAAEVVASPVIKFVSEHVRYNPARKVYPGVRRPYKGDSGRDEFEGQEDKLYPRYLAWCLREDKKPLGRTRAVDAIVDAVNRKLVPEGGDCVGKGKEDEKGTPITGIGLVPWGDVYR